ncbi:CBS domain-containing protein [Streptomyces sp. R302]|uniref:site-2 protease family protein n=1 Tax=unclassified Streptomyces TaxID=2593676 RepID=UPI00145D9A56|nr:CBS domain-containing protein [Streptomyces sp. R301]NML77574.1 CBS domain-containing protein [Streptomyces sp. R302]
MRVGVHWSALLIVVVIGTGLAARLSVAHPDLHGWQYGITAVVAAVVLLLCLLAHELSHAVVARRNGVVVKDITLWLLGGMARLRGEVPSPGAEARIAGVGPLVSLLLGVLFGLLAGLFGGLYGAGLPVEALAWLAGVNLLLAVFNALPAAPLDGGRLLRAAVWRWTGNRLCATAVATGAGRALGWALVVLGAYLTIRGVALSGLWLVVIGWFLVAVATAEVEQAKLEELLEGVTVGDVMGRAPLTVPASITVAEFLTEPDFRFHHAAFPVVDSDHRPVGLVTVNAAARVPEGRRDTPVASVMVPIEEVPTPSPEDPLVGLVHDLEESPAHRAVVVADDTVVGVVTRSDISRVTAWLASSAWRKRAF